MPILNIRDMGSIGVNSDIAPWELPPAALSSGINFRMSSGKIQSTSGSDLVTPALGDEIGHLAPSSDFYGNAKWIAMCANSIQVWSDGAWIDITQGLSLSNLEPSLWSSCRIGAVTFMNHPDYYPVYWVDEADTINQAQLLPWHIESSSSQETWEDKDYSCRVIASHKNFLFALGMKEGNDEYRDKVWWSHPAEPNGIPFSWRPTSEQPDSIAGYVNLGRGGAIVGGESLRDSFVIYSDDAVNMLDFVGDALGWRRRSVSTSADLIGKEGVVEVKGAHYLISRDDFMVFDGNSMQSLIHNRLRTHLASTITNDFSQNSWIAHNQSYNEVWFCVPTNGAEYPNLAYTYNYRDNTWASRALSAEYRHGAFGDEPFADDRTWDEMVGTWDEDRGSWAMGGNRPFAGALFGCTDDVVYDLDPASFTNDNSDDMADNTVLRRTDIPVGGHETNTTITRIYPLVEGTAPVYFRMGSAQRAGGEVRWASDFIEFTPGQDRKIDIRTTGEVHAFEIKSKGRAFFDLTGMDIEFSVAGQR